MFRISVLTDDIRADFKYILKIDGVEFERLQQVIDGQEAVNVKQQLETILVINIIKYYF
jgi:hypothetical protein